MRISTTRPMIVALALSLPLAGEAQGRPAELARGLVASYPLDGAAVDDVTRARGRETATRPIEDREGARGGALWFDGVRSAVDLGAHLQPARFTIAAWIRPEALDREGVVVSKIRNLPGHWQKNLELRVNAGGHLYLHVPSGADWEGVEGTRPLAPGRWAHVAAVYDGARARLFLDGVPDGPTLAVRYAQTRTETWIGARPESGGSDGRTPSGPTFFFRGAIDDLRVWDRPLTDDEIAVVAGRAPPAPEPARPPPGPPPSRAVAPVAIYPLDGDARDAWGGADGTLVGARPAEDRLGRPRGALALGGKDHVDLGVRYEPERFSLAVWIRPTRADREQVIFSKLSSSAPARPSWLELGLDPFGRVVLKVPSGGPFESKVTSSKRLASGRWAHLAATFDGERAALYVDGVPAGEARVRPLDASRGPVWVGARPDASGRAARRSPSFQGRIDDLRVYRGALSLDEVAAVLRESDRPPPPAPPGGDDGDGDDALLVQVGRLLVRYDAACLRRDPGRIARVEERVVREIEDAARAARGDRELVDRLRYVAREFQGGRGRTDAMSLDRKRSALAALSDALWNDVARALDDDPPSSRSDDVRDEVRREGW